MSGNAKFEDGLLHRELLVGIVSSVTAQVVRFNVGAAGSPSGTHFRGGRYGRGEVGEFVLIEGQVTHLLGRIVEIRLPEHDRRSVNAPEKHPDGLDAVGTVQLLGSVAMDSRCITAGVDSYPRLGDRVYSAPHWLLANVASLMEPDPTAKPKVTLTLGSIDVADDSAVSIKPEKLFGRHCAILGATGGGKSWTTAKIIEECLKHKCKIILLDATGEYRGLDGAAIDHFHLGSPPEKATNSTACSVPPTTFVESDFIAMFEPSGKVQGPRLQAAIKSLRLAKIDVSLATNGIVVKANTAKKKFEDAERLQSAKVTDPSSPFDIDKLSLQIEHECVFPSANFGKDTTKWGDRSEADISYCLSLITRINAIMVSPAFHCVFKDKTSPLTDVVNTFLGSAQRLLRVCLSGIPFEFKAREVVANVIGRHLLSLARVGKFKAAPLIIIVDEAHNFLGRHIGGEDTIAKLDAFELIAKEGRKFGLNICLATQRPRDITEGVLSQMGTLIVHRLTNDRDREVVERACGEIDRSAASFLPSLKPGEAAIIGADFPIPLTLQMRPPVQKPKSDGPDFQSSWA
jgi:hypothetical protein